MKLQSTFALTLALVAFAGCAKDTPIGHLAGEADKVNQEAELRAHKYVSKCSTENLVLSIVGVKSQNTVYDFQNGDAGKTIQFFSVDNCDQSKLLGQATYSGTQIIGGDAADGARTLDLNYTKVVVTISSADLASGLNSVAGQVQNCGINDWAAGAGRDVTAVAGSGSCMAVPKATQSFDIVKTDGQTTFFGLKDAAHNAETQPARPVQLDKAGGYTKM
jgi:hypothetical protein